MNIMRINLCLVASIKFFYFFVRVLCSSLIEVECVENRITLNIYSKIVIVDLYAASTCDVLSLHAVFLYDLNVNILIIFNLVDVKIRVLKLRR